MARKNPTLDKSNNALEGVIDGVDPLPIAGGINQKANTMPMPDVDMTPNDGDNPKIGSAPFANGTDRRVYSGGPQSTNATPGMPGAH